MQDYEQVEWMARCCDENPTLYRDILVNVAAEQRDKVMLDRVPYEARYHDVGLVPTFDDDYLLESASSRAKTMEHLKGELKDRYGEDMPHHVLRGDIVRFYNRRPEDVVHTWTNRFALYDGAKLTCATSEEQDPFLYTDFPLTYWFDSSDKLDKQGCERCCDQSIIIGWRTEYYRQLANNLQASILQQKEETTRLIYISTIRLNGRKYCFYIDVDDISEHVDTDFWSVFDILNDAKGAPRATYHRKGCSFGKQIMPNKKERDIIQIRL